jgi:hypothetical protein
MGQLLSLDPVRQAAESGRAGRVEAERRAWRRSWFAVYAQCAALCGAGTLLYALSWRFTGDGAKVLSALGQVVAYALPFFRLVVFFVKNADQF